MLRAKRYLGAVGVGVTAPRLIEGDDGRAYVVKLKNNRLGTKVLVNEYIAARVGDLAGLCFPPAGPIELTERFLRRCPPLARLRVHPGLHFASRYIKRAQYVRHHHLARVLNRPEMAGAMLFDHLFFNEDRTLNRRNMLVRREENGYRFFAIDHSHLFGSGRWRTENLPLLVGRLAVNQRRAYGTMLRRYLTAEELSLYAARFQAISPPQAAAIIDEVPREWLDDDAARQALKDFLRARFAEAADIAARIAAQIPRR